MADDRDTTQPGPQNLLRNTDPKARAQIAAAFGAPKPSGAEDQDAKQDRLNAMTRRMSGN